MTPSEWGPRDTFVDSTASVDEHTHFLVSDPAHDPDRCIVAANFTSVKRTTVDVTCIVEPGDCSILTRQSAVLYARARIVKLGTLRFLETQGLITRRASLSQELLARILVGFQESDDVPDGVRRFLAAQGLIQLNEDML